MRKKIMTLMMGALLLLTACGQTGEQLHINDAAGGGGAERGTGHRAHGGQDAGRCRQTAR